MLHVLSRDKHTFGFNIKVTCIHKIQINDLYNRRIQSYSEYSFTLHNIELKREI